MVECCEVVVVVVEGNGKENERGEPRATVTGLCNSPPCAPPTSPHTSNPNPTSGFHSDRTSTTEGLTGSSVRMTSPPSSQPRQLNPRFEQQEVLYYTVL